MPLNIVLLRPQNWSRLKPYYKSTITAVKEKEFDHFFRFRDSFGHFLVTFSDTFLVTFLPNSFCRTPFAAG